MPSPKVLRLIILIVIISGIEMNPDSLWGISQMQSWSSLCVIFSPGDLLSLVGSWLSHQPKVLMNYLQSKLCMRDDLCFHEGVSAYIWNTFKCIFHDSWQRVITQYIGLYFWSRSCSIILRLRVWCVLVLCVCCSWFPPAELLIPHLLRWLYSVAFNINYHVQFGGPLFDEHTLQVENTILIGKHDFRKGMFYVYFRIIIKFAVTLKGDYSLQPLRGFSLHLSLIISILLLVCYFFFLDVGKDWGNGVMKLN